MEFTVGEWTKGCAPESLEEIAALWNTNAAGRHAFYPWSGKLLEALLVREGKCVGRLLEARSGEKLVGFAHVVVIDEDGYPRAGSVEMILVDRAFAGRGVGSRLLAACVDILEAQRPRLELLNALGAWPFGYAFDALADGSERSGVFLRDEVLCRMFQKAGFEPVRKSLVMRAETAGVRPRPFPGSEYYIARRRENTWLDRVFRGRELWDHELTGPNGEVLSRAIFGFMPGESRWEKRVVFSLFGVNTPYDKRNHGYAGINLSHFMAYVNGLGCQMVELHVYADNFPALALYQRLGFKMVAETMMMHKPGV